MRRGSIGPKGGPAVGVDEVVLRSKNPSAPPAIGPGFMRRSCTFVTEGSWRKSSFGVGSGQKETKDRLNLALQVRKKAAQLGGRDEDPEAGVDSVDNVGQGRPGRVLRLVGNLRSWSSSEDVRQSVVGAFTRTVNVIKQRPSTRKVKQALAKNNNNNNNNPKSKPQAATTTSAIPNLKGRGEVVNGPKETAPPSNTKGAKQLPNKTPIPKKKSALEKGTKIPVNKAKSKTTTARTEPQNIENKKWLRHLHEAQASYNAREGRNRRPHPAPHLPDPDESAPPTDLRDVEDGVEADNSESVDTTNECISSRNKRETLDGSFNSTSATSPSAPQTPSSPETLAKKTELLRRKDLKIRQELEEKQNLIADILNIPRQDFESVADMAGEVGLSNKEPRELVLGAIYQAKKLQETLNEAQTIRDSDIIAAQACTDAVSKSSLPLYHSSLDTMEKLLNISGTLSQFLNSLMILISERDEERERMRKELVASRERVHQLHMQQNLLDQTTSSDTLQAGSSAPFQPHLSTVPPPTIETTSPHSSRPNSFVSVNSSVADHSDTTDQHNTDEEGKSEDHANSSTAEAQSTSETSTEKCEETIGDVSSLAEEEEEAAKESSSGETPPPPPQATFSSVWVPF